MGRSFVEKYQRVVVDLVTTLTRMTTKDYNKLDWKKKRTIDLCLSNSTSLNVSG